MLALVDTTVWVDFIRGRRTDEVAKLDELIGNGLVLVGDLVLCEFLRGFSSDAEAQRVEQALNKFPIVSLCDARLAVEAAANYRILRARGITLSKTVDLIIGSYCIHHSLPLLHNDHDFDAMEKYLGLTVL